MKIKRWLRTGMFIMLMMVGLILPSSSYSQELEDERPPDEMNDWEAGPLQPHNVIGYYLTLMLPDRPNPILIGPFTDRDGCWDYLEFAKRRGLEAVFCSILTIPQDSQELVVPYLPH